MCPFITNTLLLIGGIGVAKQNVRLKKQHYEIVMFTLPKAKLGKPSASHVMVHNDFFHNPTSGYQSS